MKNGNGLLEIQTAELPPIAYAGEWIPVTWLLTRPEKSGTNVRIKNVNCPDREVQLDTDLLQSDIEIRPGETYRLTVPVKVGHPKILDLERFVIQVGDATGNPRNDEPVSPPRKELRILPAIAREILISVEPLCAYDQGTKVLLTFDHRGPTLFSDLVITLEPEQAIQAGKRILRRISFGPGEKEQVEAVVNTEKLIIQMVARVQGTQTEAEVTKPIGRLLSRAERPRFRFLEPRRLSLDQKLVARVSGTDLQSVPPVEGAYPLQSGERYQIAITPQDPAVTEISLRDIVGVIHVRNREQAPDKRSWTFLVDVSGNDLFKRPERLFYDVKRGEETLTGEMPVCLLPAWGRHFRLAGVLGVALTVQGIGALVRFLVTADYSLQEALTHFHFNSDYQVFFSLSIPLVWGLLQLFDQLQYRWKN
jgi:hypothetical protein